MYTFQLNISSWTAPVIGDDTSELDWVTSVCLFRDVSFDRMRGDDDIQVRDKMNGSLIFYGQEYTALKTLADAGNLFVSLRVKLGATLILSGYLELTGRWDERLNTVTLQFVQNDQYNKILANLDREYAGGSWNNINNTFTSSLRTRWQAVETGEPFIDWDNYEDNGAVTPDEWDDEITYAAAGKIGKTYFSAVGLYDTVFVKVGGVYYASLSENNLNNPPATSPLKWVEVEEPHEFNQEYAAFEFTDSVYVELSDEYQAANSTTDTYTNVINGVKLFTVLESLLGEIDSTLDVFETTAGADTGFVQYIEDNYPNLLYLFWYSYDDDPKLKLSDILNIYKVIFNLDWKIEDGVFLFVHPSARPDTVGTGDPYDLTTFRGKDWTTYAYETEIMDKISRETWEFGESNYDDFNTVEIIYENNFPDVRNYKTNEKTDIVHALIDQEGAHVFAATFGSGVYTLYNQTGLISGVLEYNGGLSTSRCVYEHHKENRPFGSYDSATFDAYIGGGGPGGSWVIVRKRNKQVQLMAPIYSQDDMDFGYLIKTSLGNLELKQVSVKAGEYKAEITAVW